MKKNLRNQLASWDGRSSDDIGAIYQAYCGDNDLSNQLVALLGEQQCERGASWMLKQHMKLVGAIEQKTINQLYHQVLSSRDWQTRLHILQSMEYFPVVESVLSTVDAFLRRCIADDNKFVRAWAYHGFFILAQQYPQYQEEVAQFFALALRDEVPSVQARIRNILKNKNGMT